MRKLMILMSLSIFACNSAPSDSETSRKENTLDGVAREVKEAGKDVGEAVEGAAKDVKEAVKGDHDPNEDAQEAREDAREEKREAAEDKKEGYQ